MMVMLYLYLAIGAAFSLWAGYSERHDDFMDAAKLIFELVFVALFFPLVVIRSIISRVASKKKDMQRLSRKLTPENENK